LVPHTTLFSLCGQIGSFSATSFGDRFHSQLPHSSQHRLEWATLQTRKERGPGNGAVRCRNTAREKSSRVVADVRQSNTPTLQKPRRVGAAGDGRGTHVSKSPRRGAPRGTRLLNHFKHKQLGGFNDC